MIHSYTVFSRVPKVMVAFVLLVTLTMSCSAQPPRHSTTTITGCWLQAAGKPACGDLISTYGKPQNGTVMSLAGRLKIFSFGEFDHDQLYIYSQQQGCNTTTIPVWVSGNVWTPDVKNIVISLVGCGNYNKILDDGWFMDILKHKFQVSFPNNQTVCFQASDAYIVFDWT